MRSRTLPLVALLALAAARPAAAQNCLFSADFEGDDLPTGWQSSTTTVVSTGATIPAWRVGNSAQADAGGFFPVPDIPIGNRFAMVNDDAPPCDCALQQAWLTSPVIDLTGRGNLALKCRVFHEAVLGSGPAIIEGSVNGADWSRIDSVEAQLGRWQELFLDLTPFNNAPAFQLRFSWSDNGGWASGFAVDDVCLFERLQHDLAITRAFVGDPSISPFAPTQRSLAYTLLPLEQCGALRAAVEVENRGMATLQGLSLDAMASLNGTPIGPATGSGLAELEPGQRAILHVTSVPVPVSPGSLTIHLSVGHSGPVDEDPTNNDATATVRITGPGWEDGYGAMGLAGGTAQGVQRTEQNFIAAVRLELINPGSAARGISAVLDPGSQVGQQVRGILMDGSFVLIDTTLRHTLTEGDLQAAAAGEPLYLPFPTPVNLPAADCFAGLQRLSGEGEVGVLTSGNGPVGAAAFMTGPTFDITWLTAMPMVRLHLNDYGVGIAAQQRLGADLRIWPNPASDAAWLEHRFLGGAATLVITSTSGAEMIRRTLGAAHGQTLVPLDTSHLPAGAYIVRLEEQDRVTSGFFLVAR